MLIKSKVNLICVDKAESIIFILLIYITELSDADKETFGEFKERISNNKVVFRKGSVCYNTYFGSVSASYDGEFRVNDEDTKTEFDRYDCRFCQAPRKPGTIFVDNGKHTLLLDLNNTKRIST